MPHHFGRRIAALTVLAVGFMIGSLIRTGSLRQPMPTVLAVDNTAASTRDDAVKQTAVTRDSITMPQAVFADRVTPPLTTPDDRDAKRSGEATMSKFVMDEETTGAAHESTQEPRLDVQPVSSVVIP